MMRLEVEEAVEEARGLVLREAFQLGNSRARFAAQLARSAGFMDLEFDALLLSATALGMADEWEEAFLESSQLIVALERNENQLLRGDFAIQCHFVHVYGAAGVLRHVSQIEPIVRAARECCERIGHDEHAIEFDHAWARVLVARSDRGAVPAALRALALRRSQPDAPGCPLGCYTEAAVEALADAGRVDEAYEVVNEAIAREPDSAWTWGARADLAAALGRFDEAKPDYDAVLRLSERWELRVRRAITLTALGDAHGAREDVEAAAQANPGVYAALLWRSIITGRRDGIEHIQRERGWTGLLANFLAGRVAFPELRRAAARHPHAKPYLADAWLYAGVQAERQGDRSAAVKAYHRARVLASPNNLARLWTAARCGGAAEAL